ncbi:F-actin-uncapping protein LRRC16A isoform X1 [Lates japonicus]|uniref:F-actin-uncapping protein LRRC16A isoform X1 n=1 Tax=Lates japonicus TaxID=270547 RepID=A0AAD3MM04_LATJO|nr:F-actin-uncapping protein LRRC16A isoform X1 [Lates japonicus]
MAFSPQLFVPVLVLLSAVLRSSTAGRPVPTFEYRNPVTGETLTCDQCPPGTRMSAYCTATTPTQCAPCRTDHFTELWNYLPRCLYCNNFCSDHQEVETECSPRNNRVCRCKEGFYWASDFCVRHSGCEPGRGVQTKGTSQTNTVCEPCSDGYFSNSSSAVEKCEKHQECAIGQIVLLPGTVYQDTVCGTCEDLAIGGEAFRTFLSKFFSMHRMRVAKMKKFVTRYINSKMSEEVSEVPKELLESVRDALGRKVKLSLRKRVKLEIKGDKTENRVLALVISPSLPLLDSTHSTKVEHSLNYLEIQGIACNKPTQLLIEYERGSFSLKLLSTEEVNEVVAHIGNCLLRICPGLPPNKVMKKLCMEPPDRLTSLQTLWENNKPAEPGPCGGFSQMYRCVCDWLGLPYREEVQWDVDTIYLTQDTRELNLQDFSHLENRDLVAIIAVLEFNQWFTKLSNKDYKLSADVCEQILRVVSIQSTGRVGSRTQDSRQ